MVDRSWQSIKDRFLKILQPRVTDPEMLSLIKGTVPISGAILDRKRTAAAAQSPPVTPRQAVPSPKSNSTRNDTASTSDKRQRVVTIQEPLRDADGVVGENGIADDDDNDCNDNNDDDNNDEVEDPAKVNMARACIAVVSDLFGVERDVALHALLCCSGNVEMTGHLLVLGHDGLRLQLEREARGRPRADEYFTYEDDVMMRDADERVCEKRTMESLRKRWLYLEMPESEFPFKSED